MCIRKLQEESGICVRYQATEATTDAINGLRTRVLSKKIWMDDRAGIKVKKNEN